MDASSFGTPVINIPGGGTIAAVDLRREVEAALQPGPISLNDVKFLENLVARGMQPIDALAEFVAAARTADTPLMDYAIASDVCSGADIVAFLAQQYRLETVDLRTAEIDLSVTALLDVSQARELGVLPFAAVLAEDADPDDPEAPVRAYLVATADPGDVRAQQDLPKLLDAPVWFRVCAPDQLDQAITRNYERVARAEQQAEGTSSIEQDIRVGAALDSQTIRFVNQMIAQAHDDGASDIHFDPFETTMLVRLRVDGVLEDVTTVPTGLRDQVVNRIKLLSGMKPDERRQPQDGRAAFDLPGGTRLELRVTTLPTVWGESVSLRLVNPNTTSLTLNQLGLQDENLERVRAALARPWGSILVTGPTGSGKTTSLYAALALLNQRERHIITVEDPVEQRIRGINQMEVKRQGVGFAGALRSMLRADPDIIMIGEVRDPETARISVEASITGHLVLTTLHTNDAVSAVTRLTDMGVEPFLISEALQLVTAQRLARRVCHSCRQPFVADEEYLRGMRAPEWAVKHAQKQPIRLFRAKPGGCPRCRGRGYNGRIGVHEVLVVSDRLRREIARERSTDELRAIALEEGMVSLREDCFRKVIQGETSLEELARVIT